MRTEHLLPNLLKADKALREGTEALTPNDKDGVFDDDDAIEDGLDELEAEWEEDF
ncbi:MAG: hypothetical protein ACLP9K_09495 [Nitrososphaerales archaeon]|jgi:hypothetical protein